MTLSHQKKHMRIAPEIKEFTKNTLIFTLFFTLVIHLGWDYIAPYVSRGVRADNDQNFQATDITYMGNIATAYSLSLGKIQNSTMTASTVTDGSISIASLIENPSLSDTRLIDIHTRSLQSYVNLLRIDIAEMLDQANSRQTELDEHIDLLKSYYVRTAERTTLLAEQGTELRALLQDATSRIAASKQMMEEKYKAFDTDGVNSVIEDYVDAKNAESRARVYLAYIERFQRGYALLQAQNRKILDTLINNREALVNRSVVVIPDSGSDLVKKLNLVVSEAEYKSSLDPTGE